ncbi:MAG: tripartite tricarboxylate transporter TctB family protein [Betaproteobacteria bacterium]
MKIHDSLTGVLLVIFAASMLWYTGTFPAIAGDPVGPALFPRIIAVGMLACGAFLTVTGLARDRGTPWLVIPDWFRAPRQIAGFAIVVGGLLGFYLFLDRLGFLVCAPVLLAALLFVLCVRLWAIPLVAIGISLLIHVIFYKGLGVPLPWGLLARWAW